MLSDAIKGMKKQGATLQEWLEGAAALAAQSSSEALKCLLEVFYEQGWAGQETVIGIFRDKAHSLVYPVLEDALRDNANAGPRNTAMEIYIALGSASLPSLLGLLRDTDEEIRCFAAVMLGKIRDKSSVPELVKALEDPDLNVKHAAAEALGIIKDVRAVEPLIATLNADMWLQFPAVVALGELGDSRAVPPLVALLQTPGANMPAIQALGKIGDPSAYGPLSRFAEDDEPPLRELAVEAMKEIGLKNPNMDPAAR